MTTAVDTAELLDRAISRLTPQHAEPVWDWSKRELKLPEGESSAGPEFTEGRGGIFRRAMGIIASRRLRRVLSETDPHALHCQQFWLVSSAQLGKTMNVVYAPAAWHLRHFPSVPLALVWPSIDVRRMQLKGRLEPLFQKSPALAELLPDPESEAYSRHVGEKLWRLTNGGRARMLVGNIANDCRSNPMAAIGLDEFDALDENVGHQGDPIQLLTDRQRTFGPDRIIWGATTPSLSQGHGWRKLCSGSHERLMVQCECGAMDWLNPNHLVSVEGVEDPSDIRRRDAARWVCHQCGLHHTTASVRRMVRAAWMCDHWAPGTWTLDEDQPRGLWVPELDLDTAGRPVGAWPIIDRQIRSQHANLLYASTYTLGEFLADERLAIAGRESDQQAHWNTARAEPWIPTAPDAVNDDGKDAIILAGRPRGVVPEGAKWLILCYDQQGNTERLCWFPWTLRAYAPGGESWLVDAGRIDRAGGEELGGWAAVDAMSAKTWPGHDGKPWRPHLEAMDGANGNMALRVRTWAAADPSRRLVMWGDPRLPPEEPYRAHVPGKRARIPMPHGVRAWQINPTHWRDIVDARRRQTPGHPGWWICEGAPSFYLRSLWESEQRVVVQRRLTGMGVRDVIAWQPTQIVDQLGRVTLRRDNHWWDLEVMSAAIAHIYGFDKTGPPAAQPKRPPPHRGQTYQERRRSLVSRRHRS